MLDRGSAGEESGSSSRPWTLTSTDLYLDSAGPPCSNSAAMAWSEIHALVQTARAVLSQQCRKRLWVVSYFRIADLRQGMFRIGLHYWLCSLNISKCKRLFAPRIFVARFAKHKPNKNAY